MGYSTTDGATGKGLGSFTTTPSTASDLNKTIELIGRMGNRRIGTTAQRSALTGGALYEGLEFFDTDENATYRHDGTSLVLRDKDAVWTAACTLGTGWTNAAGSQNVARVDRVGNRVFLSGTIVAGASASVTSMVTVPAGFVPASTGTRAIGTGMTAGGIAYELFISSGVIQVVAGYTTASIPTLQTYTLGGSTWSLD